MCTRVLWNDNDLAVVSGRTMDWPQSTMPIITALPRGAERNGGMLGHEPAFADNPLRWTSTYGSLVTTVYGLGAADGVNERGLAAHMLFFRGAGYGERDATKPGLHAGLWAQHLLDQAATVREALALHAELQILMISAHGSDATVHLAVEDAEGDSAVLEYIDGALVAHHAREFRVMTNDPSYSEQLDLLAGQDFSEPSSLTPLPGNVNPVDRFQRVSYFRDLLPEPKDEREAVAGILSVTRNASVPFGAPYRDFGTYNTEYRTAIDLTARRYFFELTTAPNLIWLDLSELDLSAGAPALALDPDDVELSGDVTAHLRALAAAPY